MVRQNIAVRDAFDPSQGKNPLINAGSEPLLHMYMTLMLRALLARGKERKERN